MKQRGPAVHVVIKVGDKLVMDWIGDWNGAAYAHALKKTLIRPVVHPPVKVSRRRRR